MLRRGHFAEKADYGMFAIFANDFSSDVPIIFRVVAGDSVPVGRDASLSNGWRTKMNLVKSPNPFSNVSFKWLACNTVMGFRS